MKRILFVLPTLRMGGAEKALVSLLKCLDPTQVQVDLFLFEHGGILQSEVPSWVNLLPENPMTKAILLEFRYFWKDLLRMRKLRAAYARLRMTAVPIIREKLHLSPQFTWRSASSFIAPLERHYDIAIGFLEGVTDCFVIDKTSAAKKIGWVHTDFRNKTILPEEKTYYNRFQSLVTITEACRESLICVADVLPEKVHVIENIISRPEVLRLSEQPVNLQWESGLLHILTIARLEHQKGIDMAFYACKALKEANVPICWHVLGDGSHKSWLEKATRDAGMEKQFVLEGVTTNPYPYMKAAWIIVQPSRMEGKSIVLDEAKILKKAVVTTNYPSVSDQLTNGVNGIVTDMTSEALAEAIRRLADDRELVKRLETNCGDSEDPAQRPLEAFLRLIGLS